MSRCHVTPGGYHWHWRLGTGSWTFGHFDGTFRCYLSNCVGWWITKSCVEGAVESLGFPCVCCGCFFFASNLVDLRHLVIHSLYTCIRRFVKSMLQPSKSESMCFATCSIIFSQSNCHLPRSLATIVHSWAAFEGSLRASIGILALVGEVLGSRAIWFLSAKVVENPKDPCVVPRFIYTLC